MGICSRVIQLPESTDCLIYNLLHIFHGLTVGNIFRGGLLMGGEVGVKVVAGWEQGKHIAGHYNIH